MVTPTNKNSNDGAGLEGNNPSQIQSLMAKFGSLPPVTQMVLVGVVVVLLFVTISGRRGQISPSENNAGNSVATNQGAVQDGQDVFSGLDTDTPELMKSWFDQSQQDVADLRDKVEEQISKQDKALSEALNQNTQLQQDMKQILEEFKSEILNIQEQSRRDREVLGKLAEDTRKLQLNTPSSNQVSNVPAQRSRGRISQTPLGSPGGTGGARGKALLSNVADELEKNKNDNVKSENEKHPFIPPLGFVKATLLNGVDALVGGTATPALARLHGVYKTAMNSTVSLDGCFILIEFNGEISTERAIGKPSRMTCVYPDQGATTYSVSGYVVDAEDGIIGIPGIFYEGDATRLAAAMAADFASGVAGIIEQNQNTFTVDSSGNAQQTLTGSEVKAEIAGGVGKAVSSLRDYLFERASRVLPFIRIDATRDVHLVLLSGVELRAEGSPWTLLFDAGE